MTAFVLMHKLRESLMEQREDSPLSGEVEMDGVYMAGHVRPRPSLATWSDLAGLHHQHWFDPIRLPAWDRCSGFST